MIIITDIVLTDTALVILKAISITEDDSTEDGYSSFSNGSTREAIKDRLVSKTVCLSTVSKSIKSLIKYGLIAEGIKITENGPNRKRGYKKTYYVTEKGKDFIEVTK